MLRIRAKTQQRHEVRGLVNEYLAETRNEFDLILARLDGLATDVQKLQSEEVKIERIDATIKHVQDKLEARIAECTEAIIVVAGNVEQHASELGEMRHRLEYIEERLGI
jgi:uncharacterized coiled-coil protein SlyX